MYGSNPFPLLIRAFPRDLRSRAVWLALIFLCSLLNAQNPPNMSTESVFQTVASHQFHPLNEEGTFTIDRRLSEHGIADTDDQDWHVRLLALRDLVRAGLEDRAAIEAGLRHEDRQARYLAAAALGILGDVNSAPALEETAANDPSPLVRSQAVVALGQIQAKQSIDTLEALRARDPVKDVRHQAELSLDQIRKGMGVTAGYRNTWLELDPSTFENVETDRPAPDFTLKDTEDRTWNLSEQIGDGWIALIWVFADWCPLCHGEFDELIELRETFQSAGILPVTLETHDRYRARVMVGKEIDPEYWFAKESFQQLYTEKIWWPHLRDDAGAVGALYGVDPMAFAVHSEYINRPCVFLIDPEGVVRFAYRGTYWGDRPAIPELLKIVREEAFDFRHPKRLPTTK